MPISGENTPRHLFILEGQNKDNLPNTLLALLDDSENDPTHFLIDAESIFLDLHRANNRSEYPIWEHIRESQNLLKRIVAQYRKLMNEKNTAPDNDVLEALKDIDSAMNIILKGSVSEETVKKIEQGIRLESENTFVHGDRRSAA